MRNASRSTDERDMLRAAREVMTPEERESRVGRGVIRRIRGRLRMERQRSPFKSQHPELDLLFGSGRLTEKQRTVLAALVEAETRKSEEAA